VLGECQSGRLCTVPRAWRVADAEGERDDARHHAEDLRVVLGRVLAEVDDLDPGLRAAIEEALK
jgi:hypothetical protein